MLLAALALWFAPVCLAADGDSRTFGANDSVLAGNYPQQLGLIIGARNVVNLGVSGATSGDVRWSHPIPAPQHGCRNIFVLWVGANDRLLGLPVSYTEENIAVILADRQARGFEVLALTEPRSVYAGNPLDYEAGRLAENAWIRANVPHCDIADDSTLSHPEDRSVTSDGLHETRAAYGVVALRVAACLANRPFRNFR